jgi:exonuclease III
MDRVRVLTLNVGALPWARVLAPIDRRARELGRRIEDSDVDVACFQEVWGRSALTALRAALPSYPHVAFRPGPLGPAGGLAEFARSPVGTVRYASFRGLVPSGGGAAFRLARAVNSALQGVLVAAFPDLGVTVANTHLTANRDGDWSSRNRHYPFQRAQLTRLHALVDDLGPAQILVGDFNVASNGPLYPLVVGDWFDPFASSDPVTFHPAFLPAGSRSKRIDYVLVRGATAAGATTAFAEPVGGALYLSDHIGLTVRVEPVAGPGVEPGLPPL